MDDASIHVLVAKGMKMGAAHTRVSQFKALKLARVDEGRVASKKPVATIYSTKEMPP